MKKPLRIFTVLYAAAAVCGCSVEDAFYDEVIDDPGYYVFNNAYPWQVANFFRCAEMADFFTAYRGIKEDRDASENRVFLSDGTYNITTWAMSEQKVKEHLLAGDWDAVTVGSGSDDFGPVSEYRDEMVRYATPANVSQYFTMGEREIQIRTSGYCRFADQEIDPDVLSGKKTIDATGVLTMYQGNIQFVLLDQTGIKVNE